MAGEASFAGKSESGHTVMMDAHRNSVARTAVRGQWNCFCWYGRLHGVRRGAHLAQGPADITDCVAQIDANARRSIQGVHAHPCALRGEWPQARSDARRAGAQVIAEKYCSASIMFAKTAEITHDFEIVECHRLPE